MYLSFSLKNLKRANGGINIFLYSPLVITKLIKGKYIFLLFQKHIEKTKISLKVKKFNTSIKG